MDCLGIELFGGFRVTTPAGRSLVVPTRKAQALLAYCALHPGQSHTRDTLAALLWGETREEHARNSLRQSLFVLRSALGSDFCAALRVESDTIAVNPHGVDVDVVRFERLAAERTPRALEVAIALYKAELLEGLVIDEEPFEEWLHRERERLRDLAVDVLASLFKHQCEHGPGELAIATGRKLLELEPLLEAVHRALMRLLVQSGRREAALRQYDACASLLKRELGVVPEAQTEELRKQIVVGMSYLPLGKDVEQVLAREGIPVDLGAMLLIRTKANERAKAIWARAQEECERARVLRVKAETIKDLLRRGFDDTRKEVKALGGEMDRNGEGEMSGV